MSRWKFDGKRIVIDVDMYTHLEYDIDMDFKAEIDVNPLLSNDEKNDIINFYEKLIGRGK